MDRDLIGVRPLYTYTSTTTWPKKPEKPETPTRWEDLDAFVTVPEAAAFLKWSPKALYARIDIDRYQVKAGAVPPNPVPVIRNGRRIIIDTTQLREWCQREVKQCSSR